jgi:hypothetical protein
MCTLRVVQSPAVIELSSTVNSIIAEGGGGWVAVAVGVGVTVGVAVAGEGTTICTLQVWPKICPSELFIRQ